MAKHGKGFAGKANRLRAILYPHRIFGFQPLQFVVVEVLAQPEHHAPCQRGENKQA